MDSSLKIAGTLIVLTIVLTTAFNLINSFTNYSKVKLLASDLNNIGNVMKTLKDTSDQGSWRKVSITIPTGYHLLFNNISDTLEIRGKEEFDIEVNNDILYSFNINSGTHEVQLYYGHINHDQLKNETLAFK